MPTSSVGVVEVDMQVALGLHCQVEQRVASQGDEHMVEEANAGRDLGPTAAVKIEGQGDGGLGGNALQGDQAGHARRNTRKRQDDARGLRPPGAGPQCEICSSGRPLVRGPSAPIDRTTTAMLPAIRTNTPTTPKCSNA